MTADSGDSGQQGKQKVGGGGAASRPMWWLPLLIIMTVIGSMGGMLLVTETGEMGQDSAIDPVQVRLVSIHRAATGAGVFQNRSHDAGELSAWFTEQAGRPVTLPSLAAVGLEPAGGRMLTMEDRAVPMAVFREPLDRKPPLVLIMGGPGFPLVMESGEPLAAGGGRLADFHGVRLLCLDRGGAPWMATTEGTPEFMARVAELLQAGNAG